MVKAFITSGVIDEIFRAAEVTLDYTGRVAVIVYGWQMET